MSHVNAASHYKKLLVDQEARFWQEDLAIDPILDPLSDRLVSDLFGIRGEELESFVGHGVIWRTCRSSVRGVRPMFYANYWDIVQASVAFSLLAVEISIPIAIDLANEVCDQLAMVCETQLEFEGLQLADLIELMECELTVFARQRGSATFKYRIESISAKAAIDLLNMHGRFQRLIEIGDGSGCDSPEVSSLVHRRNDRTLIPELLAQDVDIR